MFKNRRAEIARENWCRSWFNEAPQDDPAKKARYYGAAWAVGHSNPRTAVLAKTLLDAAGKMGQSDPSIKWEFLEGVKMGLTKAMEALRPLGYTDKDFDKWGWLPDTPVEDLL